MKKEYLISAAGGNITVIRLIEKPQTAEWYARLGHDLIERYEENGAEQAGFLIQGSKHLEMSGGEFCGNATRAAAVLVSNFGQCPNVSHSVSGYDGLVVSDVMNLGNNLYDVTSTFSNMLIKSSSVRVCYDGYDDDAQLFDLGGIVHVVIDAPFPKNYEGAHKTICDDLKLRNKAAVGVVWTEEVPNGIKIHPLVWVKGSNTFYYETSCGSGTIAAGKATGLSVIQQVTGQNIDVQFFGNKVILSSTMEVCSNNYPLRQSAKVS